MTFRRTRQMALWIATLALTLASHAAWGETIVWTQDARLSDARAVTVTVEGTTTTLPYYLAYKKSPVNQFKLAFRHPDTQQPIVWQGARYFSPVLLDVIKGTPYLVVYGRPTQDTTAAYGCPELPYIFLRHGPDGWQAIPSEKAPPALMAANLATHEIPFDVAGRHLSPDDVAQKIAATETQTSGLLPKVIPRAIAEWHAKARRSALTDRLVGDCRPPRALQAVRVLPPAKQVASELLESVDYVPEAAHTMDDWNQRSVDTRRFVACQNMFKYVEPDPYNSDLRFTFDKTGAKPVPHSHQGEWEAGVQLMCDANLWFIAPSSDPKQITITQTTLSGEQVFRITFSSPASQLDLVGTLLWPTVRADANYLYFDWAFGRAEGAQWLVKRVLKMRVPLQ